MNITSLSSGSKGNCMLVECGNTNILIDTGLSMKKMNEKLLMSKGIDLDDINFIFTSHSHSDHIQSLHSIHNNYEHIEFIMNDDVYQTIKDKLKAIDFDRLEIHKVGSYFYDDITVSPFELEHDKPTLGFKIVESETNESLVFISDNGMLPYKFRDLTQLFNATYYAIESNYDEYQQYTDTTRNELLKRRVLSTKGHSSNFNAIEKACMMVGTNTKGVMFHHLSEHCNSEEIASESHQAYMATWGKKTQFKSIVIRYARQNEIVELNR